MHSARPAASYRDGFESPGYKRTVPASKAIFYCIRRFARSIGTAGQFVAWLAMFAVTLTQVAQAQTAPSIEQRFAESLTAIPQGDLAVSGAFYVPAYSSVSMSAGKLRADFSVTLSIHNASEQRPVVLKRIAYFDSTGKLVENFLKNPIALKPFATVEIFVPANDVRGGTGANFVVDWASTGGIAEPVIEALMIGSIGSGHYAFISQGRRIDAAGKN